MKELPESLWNKEIRNRCVEVDIVEERSEEELVKDIMKRSKEDVEW